MSNCFGNGNFMSIFHVPKISCQYNLDPLGSIVENLSVTFLICYTGNLSVDLPIILKNGLLKKTKTD